MESNFPHLQYLFGAYFHQDFFEDFGDCQSAVGAFVRENQEAYVQSALADLDRLVSLGLTEPELDYIIDELGCYYAFSVDDLYPSEWLAQVREQIRQCQERK